jgi:hypothetical protein
VRRVLSVPLAIVLVAGFSAPGFALDPYDVPTLNCIDATGASITLEVCAPAGGTGAPAGITIHWTTLDQWLMTGWDDPICELSLSGQPSLQHPGKSRWELLAGECETITIGDINFDETGVSGNDCAMEPLDCGTEYVFRVFAHAGRGMGRSAFSDTTVCSTDPCAEPGEGCSFTQGFWKNHGPGSCQQGNNDNEWPTVIMTDGMYLGNTQYTPDQLCSILEANAGGNYLIALAHQLIAAKMNVANNTDTPCQDVLDDIAAADVLIGDLVVPPVGGGSLSSAEGSALNDALTAFNEGDRCGGNWLHCDTDPTPGARSPASVEPSSWGKVKADYR